MPANLQVMTKDSPDLKPGQKDAYALILEAIDSHVYRPGDRLVESDLADRFGMSRTPIREALVRLAGEGLVETLPNRSAVVAIIDFAKLHTFFDAITLMYRVTTRLAAQYHRPEDLTVIRGHQARYVQAVAAKDPLAMIAINRDFHAAIAEAGRNAYFTSLTLRVLDDGRRILRLYYQSFDDQLPREYSDEHDKIIAAIAARDIDLCDRLAGAHADQIVRQIRAFFAREMRQHVPL